MSRRPPLPLPFATWVPAMGLAFLLLATGAVRQDTGPSGESLDPAAQKAMVARWEKTVSDGLGHYRSDDDEAKRAGIDALTRLLSDIYRNEGRLTDPELRDRREKVEERIREQGRKLKWLLLESFQRRGLTLLTELTTAVKRKEWDAARGKYEELKPLCMDILRADEDFIDVADDLLAQSEATWGATAAQAEFDKLGLEIVEIVLPGAPGGEPVVRILNPDERPSDDSAPTDWNPRPRRYTTGQTIVQLEEVFVRRIHAREVEIVWKDRFLLTLELEGRPR